MDVSTLRFAGASALKSALEDVDGDGDLDLVLHFLEEDTNLRQIHEQLLIDDQNADGVLDSTRQVAEVSPTGETVDQALIKGFDELELFLSGKALGRLLEDLF